MPCTAPTFSSCSAPLCGMWPRAGQGGLVKPAFEQDIPWLGAGINKDCSFVGVGVCE